MRTSKLGFAWGPQTEAAFVALEVSSYLFFHGLAVNTDNHALLAVRCSSCLSLTGIISYHNSNAGTLSLISPPTSRKHLKTFMFLWGDAVKPCAFLRTSCWSGHLVISLGEKKARFQGEWKMDICNYKGLISLWVTGTLTIMTVAT